MSSYPTRSHKLYNGSDSLPVNDYTEEEWTDWQATELASAADGADSTTSTWVVRDESGVIPDNQHGVYLQQHNVVVTQVGSNTLWRGRIDYLDRKRGRQFAAVGAGLTKGRAAENTVNLSDANSHLAGIIVHNWARPAETDAARVQALVAAYLSGHPRATTNLNGSNLVITGSNTITLPAKTYFGVTPSEILTEIADTADKEVFVTVDNELAYFGHDYAGYNSTLRISDDPADLNANTCVPIAPSKSENGRDSITALRTYWGAQADNTQQTFQRVDNTREALNDYWEDVNNDDVSTTWDEASLRATNIFNARKRDQTLYTVTIGAPGTDKGQPMSGDDIYKVKAGQLIDFKSLAARGGIEANGAWTGDSFLTRRIREVRWTFTGVPDQYWCTLLLDRPRHVIGSGPPFNPGKPDTGTPGTPPSSPTTDFYWTFYDRGGTAAGNLFDDGTDTKFWTQAGWNTSESAWWGGSGMRTDPLPVTPGETYTFTADLMQNSSIAAAWMRVEWRSAAGTVLQTDYIGGPGLSLNVFAAYSKVAVAPAGADNIYIRCGCFRGKKGTADNVYMKHGGTGGTAGTPSTAPVTTVGLPGSGSYTDSNQYVPIGSVLELSQDAVDELLAEAAVDVSDGTTTVTPTSTLRLPTGGVDDAGGGEARLRVLLSRGGGGDLLSTITATGSAEDLDLSIANVYDLTLDADCTFTFSNPPATDIRARWTIILRQDATGSRDVTWPAEVVWRDTDGTPTATPPALSTAAGAVDVVILTTLDGGASYGASLDNGTGSTDPTLGGDLSGTASAATVEAVQGVAVTDAGTTGDVLTKTGALTATWSTPSSSSGVGQILISDTPSTPLVFADLLQNEAQDDLLYGDP